MDFYQKAHSEKKWMKAIFSYEAEYLAAHPTSTYLTEILPLKAFPDLLDYMPRGCIARKIRIMGYMPKIDATAEWLAISKDEYRAYTEDTVNIAACKLTSLIDAAGEKSI